MPKIRDLKQKRTKLGADAKAIMDAAVEAGRDMTAEEEQSFDRLMDERDKIDKNIERQERLEDDPPDPGDLDDPDDGSGGRDRGRDRGKKDDKQRKAEMEAFRAYVMNGRTALTESQWRALNMSNDPEGGFLVAPQQFVEQLLQNVDDMVDIRRLATTMPLTEGESLGVPALDTDLNDAEWTKEIGTGSQDDSLRFGKRELRPHPVAKRVKVSRSLLRRATLDPEAIVNERLSFKFGVTQEKAFMTGDGNEKPLGLFTASSQGISTSRDVEVGAGASGGDLPLTNATSDQLIDAKYTLKPQYYRNARWIFHRDIVRIIRKVKDGDGNYVWRAGLAADQADTILDLPFLMNEFTPNTITNDAYIGMLGDFSFYWIADALDMEIQRLMELYAETNQVGFIGRLETDGMPVLEEPFVRLQVPSAP